MSPIFAERRRVSSEDSVPFLGVFGPQDCDGRRNFAERERPVTFHAGVRRFVTRGVLRGGGALRGGWLEWQYVQVAF